MIATRAQLTVGKLRRCLSVATVLAWAALATAGCIDAAKSCDGAPGSGCGVVRNVPPSPAPSVGPHAPSRQFDWTIPKGRAGGIEGYAGSTSVGPAEDVTLFVSSSAPTFSVRAYRMGWYGRATGLLVWASPAIPAVEQPGPALEPVRTGTVTAHWQPTVTISTRGWPAGGYLLKLRSSTGGASFVPLVVRAASAAGRVVLISPVTTWQAYNMWGGRDLYQGKDGTFDTRSRAVSFDRPYQAGAGAADFIRGELAVVAEAERLRLPLDYVTDIDLEQSPHLLQGARAVISMGHDEYWSPRMRAALTSARAAGTNIAFFGANGIFRRIRFASTGLGADRLEVNYKVPTEDPLNGKNNAAVTANWPAPPAADPESSLLGAGYACNLGPGNISDGIVVAPTSWIFAGTGVRADEALPGLIASETDAVQPGYPTPRPLEVLLHSPVRCPSGGPPVADTTYYTARSGAGVFDAGTIAWACAINASCVHAVPPRTVEVVQRASDNILLAFAAGPAGYQYRARDNLAELRITSS